MERDKLEQIIIVYGILTNHFSMTAPEALSLMGDGHVITGWEVGEHPGLIAETLVAVDEYVKEVEHGSNFS